MRTRSPAPRRRFHVRLPPARPAAGQDRTPEPHNLRTPAGAPSSPCGEAARSPEVRAAGTSPAVAPAEAVSGKHGTRGPTGSRWPTVPPASSQSPGPTPIPSSSAAEKSGGGDTRRLPGLRDPQAAMRLRMHRAPPDTDPVGALGHPFARTREVHPTDGKAPHPGRDHGDTHREAPGATAGSGPDSPNRRLSDVGADPVHPDRRRELR